MIATTLKQFYDYLLIKGYQEETSRNRYLNVHYFFSFTKKDFLQITEEDVKTYYDYLKQRPNKVKGKGTLKHTSVLHHIRSIELFYLFLFELKKTTTLLQIELPKSRQDDDFVREILTQAEIQQLYNKANAKEKVILNLAYGCGLRVSELVAVNKEDIYLKENLLIVPKGKYSKRRIIPFTEKMKEDLLFFLCSASSDKVLGSIEITQEPALILNTKGTRMQEWTYNSLLKGLLKQIGIDTQRIKKIGIHSLRHSVATHLLENGMELEQVREFLGHEQLETTQIYTHISQTQLNEIRTVP